MLRKFQRSCRPDVSRCLPACASLLGHPIRSRRPRNCPLERGTRYARRRWRIDYQRLYLYFRMLTATIENVYPVTWEARPVDQKPEVGNSKERCLSRHIHLPTWLLFLLSPPRAPVPSLRLCRPPASIKGFRMLRFETA